ncbi:unnamed protein product [Alternaria alternata]
MMLEAYRDPSKILAHVCSYNSLSSRLVEEAGFPIIFLAGYPCASSYGLPNTGYIAMAEMCDKIQEAVRQVTVPVIADADTGYIECGHTKGKAVVSRGEAFARVQAACDAQNKGKDIFDEVMTRAREFKRISVNAVFVEALPDRQAISKCVEELDMPVFANIIEGGLTQNLSAKDLANLGFCAVAYPWTLVTAKLKSIRKTLEALKKSITKGAPPMILSYSKVCEGVGFNRY